MKRTSKIALIVVGVLLGIVAALFVGLDVAMSRFVHREVNNALAQKLPDCKVSFSGIHIRFFSATASVYDLQFTYRGAPLSKKDTIGPGAEIYVKEVAVGRLFYSMLLRKQLCVHDIRIINPEVELWMDEEHPEKSFPTPPPSDEEPQPFPFKRAELQRLHIRNASLALHSLRTKLDVRADSCSLSLRELCYADSAFTYCDSIYSFSLGHAVVTVPDGDIRLETRDIHHRNQGVFAIGRTRLNNTMPRKALGDRVKEPVTWIDLTFERVELGAFNPIRKALAQDLTLDKVNAVIAKMDVFRDERYEPKHPFPMPQEILTSLPFVYLVKHVDAQIKHIHIDFASTDKNIGQLESEGIKAVVKNVTNRKGQTMTVDGGCPLQSGRAVAHMAMTMDKECTFEQSLHAENINADFLNGFVRPLVGISCECPIDTLDASYKGDAVACKGTFCMQYNGLNIEVHQEDDIPYKIIKDHAKTFQALGNSLIPKSNPTVVDPAARAYEIEWKRDEMKPVPLYLFGPCIDGVKKTFLPGLYVHKQVKRR